MGAVLEDMEASVESVRLRLKLRLKLSLRLKLKQKLRLKLKLRLRLKLKLKLRLRLSTVGTEAVLEDIEASVASVRLSLRLRLRLRLSLWPRLRLRLMPSQLQLSLYTDTKNYRYEEPLFEYIPFFPEPHLLRTLQVTHMKSLEPIRMCACAVLIRTYTYLKHIDSVYFDTDL